MLQDFRYYADCTTLKFILIAKYLFYAFQAEEASEQKRSATAKLFVTVKPVDSNPPVINASATEGFADENAPVGTKVVDKNGNPIRLTVSDEDLVRMNICTNFQCVSINM